MFLPERDQNKILELVVKATFPNLNPSHQNILHRYMLGLIEFIATCFDFYSDIDSFRQKITQNRYKDCRWLLTNLIPYVDTSIKGLDELTDLNELYTLEADDIDINDLAPEIQNIVRNDQRRFNLDPISFGSPKYVFSNIQYSRFDKTQDSYKKIEFSLSHIEQNYKLLLGTIKEIRNKMHVNWMDIIPVRMDDYKSTNLYKHAYSKLMNKDTRFEEWDPINDFYDILDKSNGIEIFNNKASGINIEDMYNTVSMDLYESIVQYKWLLFDSLIIIEKDPKFVPNIYLINAIFPTFKAMLINYDMIRLDDELRKQYEDNFNSLFKSYPFVGPVGFSNSTIVVIEGTINALIESMVLFFDQKYSNISKNDSTYVPLPATLKKDNVDDYEQIRSLSEFTGDIKNTIASITPMAFYDFLSEALQGFKSTWYGTKLLNVDKTAMRTADNEQYYIKWGLRDNEIITYKNVYNFCKSLVHSPNVKLNIENSRDVDPTKLYTRFPKIWSELNVEAKEEFTKRINGEYSNHLEWFNIYWNILRPYVAANPNHERDAKVRADTLKTMKNIHDALRESILSVVFESMISRGTMTRMISKLEFTNEDLYDLTKTDQKKLLVSRVSSEYFSKSSPFMKECFYYLTNKPYSETTSYRVKFDDDIQDLDYIKAVSSSGLAFYLATAYNWIAQIGFCHRFINNRVTFLTAATGAGKSTEIPKLYLYYLKSIDRIDDGTVIVTVPRKNVAEGVSSYISKQMALPYEVYDDDDQKQVSTNYTIQFKHSGSGNKFVKNGHFPKIRFVTDGSVLLDMKNPFLRTVRVNKQKNNVFTKRDIYHVVLVDEAHEHNANMDMILSMARNVAYYNNRFRLGIISATIEADEPIYRRYYRSINDNRKYPQSSWIEKHNLDRINTERRIHISPPDVGTRFPIQEFYEPGANPIDVVKNIVSTTTSGDILVFQPGTAEIGEIVKALNEQGVMPADVIAIPLHAKISADKQKIINDISRLKMAKDSDFTKVDIFGGNASYSRMVIVATNIAEASITINTLKYVVETGLEKTARFNYKTRTVSISSNLITDASRLQRRGRVGRTSSGTVYYTYEKGSMENNRKQFNISVQDSHLSIYLSMLRDQKDLPIFTPLINDIVSGKFVSKLDSKTMRKLVIESYSKISNDYDSEFVHSVIDILNELYFSNGVYYSYVGSDYDATSFERNPHYPFPMYFSGYDVKELTDARGKFYIVHPDELSIKRNINGDVCEADPDVIKLKLPKIVDANIPGIQNLIMHSSKIRAFWSTLLDEQYCTITDANISKTPLGSIILYGLTNLTDIQENQDLAKMAMLAYGMTLNDKAFDLVLSVLCYLAVVDTQPLNAFEVDKHLKKAYRRLSMKYHRKLDPSKKDVLQKTKSIFNPTRNNRESDLAILIDVINLIDTIIAKQDNESLESMLSKTEMKSEFNQTQSYLVKYISGFTDDTGFNESANDIRNELLDGLITSYSNYQIGHLNSAIYFLKDLGINIQELVEFIKLRESVRQTFRDMIKGVDAFKRRVNIEGFETFSDIRKILKIKRDFANFKGIDLIRSIVLMSYPYSVVRKIDDTKHHYVSVYAPSLDTMYSIASASRNYYYPNTYVDSEALQDYVHYFKSNTDLLSIETLIQIEPTDLQLISHIYAPIIKDYKISRTDDEIRKYTNERHEKRYGMNVIPPAVSEGDEFDAINRVGDTVNKIKQQLEKLIMPNQGIELTDYMLGIDGA